MVFVVERRTTKYLPTKQYCIVPGCGLVHRNHKKFSTNWPKIHCSRKFYPPKNTRYTVIMYRQCALLCRTDTIGYTQQSYVPTYKMLLSSGLLTGKCTSFSKNEEPITHEVDIRRDVIHVGAWGCG